MAEKKFGLKRICENCSTKFYDFNKKSSLICPHCEKEVIINDDYTIQSAIINQKDEKVDAKDEFADIDNGDNGDNGDNSDDEVISLDEAAIEEDQQDTKG